MTRREVGAAGTTIEPQTNYVDARLVHEMRGGQSQIGTMVTDMRCQMDAVTQPIPRSNATVFLLQCFHRFGGCSAPDAQR